MQMHLISPFDVDKVWKFLTPYLEKACKRTRGTYRPDEMFRDCRNGSRNLLIFTPDGEDFGFAAICTFGDMDGQRICHLNLTCGADRFAWVDEIPQFSKWAKSHGAKQITFMAGKAHQRFVPNVKIKSITYGLDI